MNDDGSLLRIYATERSEAAFAELVRRHLDLVYSAALRNLRGDSHRAQDVTQRVFADLARKAGALSKRQTIAGWLHVSAHHAAAEIMRSEERRQRRELESQLMNEPRDDRDGQKDWAQIEPVLDGVLGKLGDADRDIIILRFFEKLPFAEIGAQLRMSEDTAQKRASRALEKMRSQLAAKGITSSAVVLGGLLTAQGVVAAPVGLAATTVATGGALSLASAPLAALTLMNAKSIGIGIAAALAIGVPVGSSWVVSERRQTAQVSARLAAAEAELQSLKGKANAPLAASIVPGSSPRGNVRTLATIDDRVAGATPTSIALLLEEVEGMPPSPHRNRLLTSIFKQWGRVDAVAAIAAAAKKKDADRFVRENEILSGWVVVDPSAAFAWARANRSEIRVGGTYSLLIDVLLEAENPNAAQSFVVSMIQQSLRDGSYFESQTLSGKLSAYYAAYDIAKLNDYIAALPAGSGARNNALSSAAGAIVRESPELAMQFAFGLPDEAERKRVIEHVFMRWGLSVEPAASVEWASRQSPGANVDLALDSLVSTVARKDTTAALGMLSGYSSPEARTTGVKNAAWRMMFDEPSLDVLEKTVDLIAKAYPPIEERTAVLSLAVERLAEGFWDSTAQIAILERHVAALPGLSEAERAAMNTIFARKKAAKVGGK